MKRTPLSGMSILLGLPLAVSLLIAAPAGATTPPPAARCLADKTVAAGIEARAAIGCAQRALASGNDTACRAKAAGRRADAFDAAEARGGCAQVADSIPVGGEVGALHDALVATLRPGGPAASKCTAMQLAAAARTVAKLARGHARDDRSPDAVRLASSIAAAYAQLATALSRAAARGDCLSTTDAAQVRALLERAVARVRGTLIPSCGDDVRAGSEACDGADLGGCPQACGSDCTCASPPPVCGNGVIEQGEECDGGTVCRNRRPGEYGCHAPPDDHACQCCATTGPCYVRGFGNAAPVETPCCTGTCDVPGPEAGPNAIAFCSDLPPATCPCWTAATIDATFPPGYFTTDGRGGASCYAADGVFGVATADQCDLPMPAGGTLTSPRAGVAMLGLFGCTMYSDLDPEDDGYCSVPPFFWSLDSSREGAACLAEVTASQAYQSACP